MVVLSVFLSQLAARQGHSLFWDRGHLDKCVALLCLISKAVISASRGLFSIKKNVAVITNVVKYGHVSRKEVQVAKEAEGGSFSNNISFNLMEIFLCILKVLIMCHILGKVDAYFMVSKTDSSKSFGVNR